MCTQGEIHGPVSDADEESATRIRRKLERSGTLMVNLISAPGSGKTALLEAAISRMKDRLRLAAVEGDVAAEGIDTPLKYPALFSEAALVLITKADLLPYVRFDVERVRHRVARINPDAAVMVTAARTGEGLGGWCGWLEDRLKEKRARRVGPVDRAGAEHVLPTA